MAVKTPIWLPSQPALRGRYERLGVKGAWAGQNGIDRQRRFATSQGLFHHESAADRNRFTRRSISGPILRRTPQGSRRTSEPGARDP